MADYLQTDNDMVDGHQSIYLPQPKSTNRTFYFTRQTFNLGSTVRSHTPQKQAPSFDTSSLNSDLSLVAAKAGGGCFPKTLAGREQIQIRTGISQLDFFDR